MKQWTKYLTYKGLTDENIERNKSFLASANKFSHDLRVRATPSELSVKEFLDLNNVCYKFQHVIFITKHNVIERFFIADFYIPKLNLVIELDGQHHYTEKYIKADGKRDELIKKKGFNILRIPNRYGYNYNLLYNLIIREGWKANS